MLVDFYFNQTTELSGTFQAITLNPARSLNQTP